MKMHKGYNLDPYYTRSNPGREPNLLIWMVKGLRDGKPVTENYEGDSILDVQKRAEAEGISIERIVLNQPSLSLLTK